MKRNIRILLPILACLFLFSCELDNYDAPNSSIFGKIIDQDGEAVQSDASGQGVTITYIEKGDFTSPVRQAMRLMTDGTYRNDAVFSGTYDIVIRDANFLNIDTLKNYVINPGKNELDFTVQPYIKITNLKLEKVDNKVVAKFNLKTLGNNATRVDRIQLFAYLDKVVGFGAKFTTVPSTAGLLVLNKAPGIDEEFMLDLDLSTQGDTFSKYPTSTQFWFRVGALVVKADASAGSNPKWNYSEPVQIAVNQ